MDRLARIFLFAALLLAGCQPALTPSPTAAPTLTPLPPTVTPAPTATVTPEPTITLTPAEVYDTTEYTGVFSEKYPPSYKDSFVYTEPESGIEIPIYFGLAKDIEVKELHLTDLGKEAIGLDVLSAVYYQYTENMGNEDVSMEQFLELVKQGDGKVITRYFDEITGEKKKSLYDLHKGVSVTVTHRTDMPLESDPSSAYPYHGYFSMNKDGQLIIVIEFPSDYQNYLYQEAIVKDKWNPSFWYSFNFFNSLESGIDYWALVDSESFSRDGFTREMGVPLTQRRKEISQITYSDKTAPQTKTETALASVVFK